MESSPQQVAEGAAIVKVLADVLDRLVVSNAGLARQDPGQVTKFHALKAPGIGILPYLERIHKYASCSNECFILALIYIDRLIQRNNFLLTELNVHRVVITAILLAAKFFDDAYYNNAYYSKVGGVLVSEMNGLEVDFLFRINFSLHVTPELFEKYKAELVAHSASSGHLMTAARVDMPQMEIPTQSKMPLHSVPQTQALAAPLPILQTHQVAAQVTPSPSHTAAQMIVPAEPRPVYGPATTVEQQALYTAEQQQVLTQQQLLQRANSLPPFPSQSSHCVYNNNNPPYSAPMVSMQTGGAEDQYLVMNNQLLPLQTTLVHHNHGVPEPLTFHSQPAGNRVHGLPNGNFGPLVAGHY